MKITPLLYSVILAASACRPAENVGSCSTSIAGSKDVYSIGKPYNSALMGFHSSKGTKWCNATIYLEPNGSSFDSKIVTAKHCLNPWDFKGSEIKISGELGFIDAQMNAPLLSKLKMFSDANSGFMNKFDILNEFSFDQMYIPGRTPSQPHFLDMIYKTPPNGFARLNNELKAEEKKYGNKLCERNFNTEEFPEKACFTSEDLVAFDANIKIPSKFYNPVAKSVTNFAPSDYATFVVDLIKKRSDYEFELFQTNIWQILRQCSPSTQNILMVIPENLDMCKDRKEAMTQLLNNSSFYSGNEFVNKSILTLENEANDKLNFDLRATYLDTANTLIEFYSSKIDSAKDLTILNNIKDLRTGFYKTAYVSLSKVSHMPPVSKPYGVVASLNREKLMIYKGDSGSMLLYADVPLATLSTYNGNPVASGISSIIPTAEEKIIPEIGDSVPSEVDSVDSISTIETVSPSTTVSQDTTPERNIIVDVSSSSAENCL